MPSKTSRASKVISIRLPDDDLETVMKYIEDGRATKMTGAIQDLVALGVKAYAQETYADSRRAAGVAGLRSLVVKTTADAHRLVDELAQLDPAAARSVTVELVQVTARLLGRVSEAADAGTHESKMKK